MSMIFEKMLYHPFVSIIFTESEHNFFDSLRKAQITNIKKFIKNISRDISFYNVATYVFKKCNETFMSIVASKFFLHNVTIPLFNFNSPILINFHVQN